MSKSLTINKLALMRVELEKNNVELVLNDTVREFVELKEAVEAEIKATWKALEAYLIENDVKDVFNLTVAERRTWKATGTLPPRFYKQTLDTARLNFMFDHGDALPKNVKFSTSKYLTKTNRKVAEVA